MNELVEFLRTRLTEDEEAAREAADQVGGGRWQQRNVQIVTLADRDREVADFVIVECIDHIVRHDPARVLREVEAKRLIIQRHERLTGERSCQSCWPSRCDIYTMALPYSDHPSYNESWRP